MVKTRVVSIIKLILSIDFHQFYSGTSQFLVSCLIILCVVWLNDSYAFVSLLVRSLELGSNCFSLNQFGIFCRCDHFQSTLSLVSNFELFFLLFVYVSRAFLLFHFVSFTLDIAQTVITFSWHSRPYHHPYHTPLPPFYWTCFGFECATAILSCVRVFFASTVRLILLGNRMIFYRGRAALVSPHLAHGHTHKLLPSS